MRCFTLPTWIYIVCGIGCILHPPQSTFYTRLWIVHILFALTVSWCVRYQNGARTDKFGDMRRCCTKMVCSKSSLFAKYPTLSEIKISMQEISLSLSAYCGYQTGNKNKLRIRSPACLRVDPTPTRAYKNCGISICDIPANFPNLSRSMLGRMSVWLIVGVSDASPWLARRPLYVFLAPRTPYWVVWLMLRKKLAGGNSRLLEWSYAWDRSQRGPSLPLRPPSSVWLCRFPAYVRYFVRRGHC
jgi:hypothetical protein